MRKQILTFLVVLLTTTFSFSQNARKLPNIEVKTLKGDAFNISELNNDGSPIVISFWATWCKPCKKELNNISEVYEDWQDETNVKLIAISIDDSRNTSKLKPFINSKGWEYEIYNDPNSDFKRALGVNSIPHTFLFNKKMEIVWENIGYTDGHEYDLYEKVKELKK